LSIIFGIVFSVGCDETTETQTPEEPAAMDSNDFYESGRLRPHSYHKSPVSYPNFSLPGGRWNGDFPVGCDALKGEAAFACAEQIFWEALQFDVEGRPRAYEQLGSIIDRLTEEQALSSEFLAILYWRRAQIGTALITEQELVIAGDYTDETLVAYGPNLIKDMESGLELDPENDRIRAWLFTNQLFAAVLFGADVTEMAEELVALYDEDPAFVIASAGPPLMAMPMNSGWPQRIAEMYLNFDQQVLKDSCNGECFAPSPIFARYTLEGGDYTLAEVMARIGDRERTQYYLERSLSHPTAEKWPHRYYSENALADLDGFLGKFAERGDDEAVFDLMTVNGRHACMVCHDPR